MYNSLAGVKPYKPRLREDDIDFDQLGTKYIRGRWEPTTVINWYTQLRRFFNFVIEVFLYQNDRDLYMQNHDMDVTYSYNGRTLTPDFLRKVPAGVIPVDFKCGLRRKSESTKNQIYEEMVDKYGPNVEVVFLTADNEFGEQIRDKVWKNVYFTIFKSIQRVLGSLPPDQKQAKIPDYWPSFTELLSKSEEVQDMYVDEVSNLVDQYTINRQILEHMDDMERWANKQFLPTSELVDHLKTAKRKETNIWIRHPWDRDANRLLTSSVRDTQTKWGHRATCLYQIIPSALVVSTTLSNLIPAVRNSQNPLASYIADTILVEVMHREKLDAIKELLIMKAKCKSATTKEDVLKFSNITGSEPSKIISDLENKIKLIIHDIQSDYNGTIKLSKHGNVVIADSNIRELTKKREKTQEKDEYSVVETGDYFEGFDPSQFFVTRDLQIPDVKDAYPFNESLNEISNELAETSTEILGTILSSKQFSSVYSYIQFYRAIVAAAPRVATKGYKTNEGVVTKHPDGYWIFVSPSPNEITSGIVVIMGCVGSKLPEWCMDGDYVKTHSGLFYISKPFRVNLKIAVDSQGLLGSYLGDTILRACNETKTKDWLRTSLYWAFSRQIVYSADLLYIMYKNLTNIGSFGRSEVDKKLNEIVPRDVRCAAIVRRLVDGYNPLATEVLARVAKKRNPFENLMDPVFKFTLNNWQSVMCITYTKQLFPKHDGYDAAKVLGDLFRSEMDHQNWYNESEFHPSKVNVIDYLGIPDFFNKLWSEDPWAKISYHPHTCYNYTMDMIQRAMDKNPDVNPYRDWCKEAVSTGKSTKCYITTEQVKLYGTDPKFEKLAKEKSKYKGCISSNTTEALVLEQKAFNNHIQAAADGLIKSPWEGVKPDPDRKASMIELVLYEMQVYPKCVVVNMVDKEQAGAGKRAFFVQLIFNRNANKLWDETFRPILVEDPHDMILTPGLEKYKDNQTNMEKIGYKIGKMGITKDATRFGDTYMIETLTIQIMALVKSGYLTEDEGQMLMYFRDCLYDRVVLMPHQNAKIMVETKMDKTASKWVKEFNKYSTHLNNPMKYIGFTKPNSMNTIKENISMQKNIGFVLGVFNIAGSMYTSAYSQMIYDLEKIIGIENVALSQSHSDDCHETTNLSPPQPEVWKDMSVSKLVRFLLRNEITLNYSEGVWWHGTEFNKVVVPGYIISKLHLILGLFTPRFVSQRPSLLKWAYGYSNEVLQVVSIDGQIKVPLIRYASAIGKLLPNESPGSDTYMMSGRYYDMIVNGADNVTVSTMILAGNFIISQIYGLDNARRHVNHPPEIGGLWWSIPSMILSDGFEANEVRLYSLEDEKYKRILKLMINTEDIWNKEHKPDERRDALSRMVLESVGIEDYESSYGGVEYRKDFKIRLDSQSKTDMGFAKLMSVFRQDLDSLARKTGRRKPLISEEFSATDSELILLLKERYFMDIQSGSPSFLKSVISTIQKYTTPGMKKSYARNSDDIKIVAQMGYFNRSFANPFSLLLKTQYENRNQLINADVMRIQDLWNLIVEIAESNFPIPSLNETGYQMSLRLLNPMISNLLNIYWIDSGYRKTRNIDAVNIKYTKVKPNIGYAGMGNYVSKSLAAIFQMDTEHIRLNETDVIRNIPRLENDSYFREQVEVMRTFLKSINFEAIHILKHFRLIVRILNPIGFYGVVGLPDGDSSVRAHMSDLWSYDTTRFFNANYEMSKNTVILSEQEITKRLISSRFDRIITLVLWKHYCFPDEIKLAGEFWAESTKLEIPTIGNMIDKIALDGPSKTVFTQLLAVIIYRNQLRGGNDVQLYKSTFQQKGLITSMSALIINDLCEVRIDVEYDRDGYRRGLVFLGEETYGYSHGPQAFAWISFLSYLTLPPHARIKSPAMLLVDVAQHPDLRYVSFGKEMAFEDTPNANWIYYAIRIVKSVYVEDLHQAVPTMIGFSVVSPKKNDENNTYLVMPWDLGDVYTNLRFMDSHGNEVVDRKVQGNPKTWSDYTYKDPGSGLFLQMPREEAIAIASAIYEAIGEAWDNSFDDPVLLQLVRLTEIKVGFPLVTIRETCIDEGKTKRMRDEKKALRSGAKNIIINYLSDFSPIESLDNKLRMFGWALLTCWVNSQEVDLEIEKTMVARFNETNGLTKYGAHRLNRSDDGNVMVSVEAVTFDYSSVNMNSRRDRLPVKVFTTLLSIDPRTVGLINYFYADKILCSEYNIDTVYLANITEITGELWFKQFIELI